MLQQNTAMIRTDADYSRVLFFTVLDQKLTFLAINGVSPHTPNFL